MASGFLGTIFVVVLSTALVATLLMFFVNPEYVNPAVVQRLAARTSEEIIAGVGRPTPVQTPHWLRRIGIISGHRGTANPARAIRARYAKTHTATRSWKKPISTLRWPRAWSPA